MPPSTPLWRYFHTHRIFNPSIAFERVVSIAEKPDRMRVHLKTRRSVTSDPYSRAVILSPDVTRSQRTVLTDEFASDGYPPFVAPPSHNHLDNHLHKHLRQHEHQIWSEIFCNTFYFCNETTEQAQIWEIQHEQAGMGDLLIEIAKLGLPAGCEILDTFLSGSYDPS